eukprot:CAMPEP_0180643922 /NCGR_PEP_ID=MMETSP1037_2-20121125/48116_1 /TAXON_ID=632150 /ORGANISM="Azadinium spinosum, Strain 3D9" /LENGTH=56 /DNA_ID=CAMNT_0022667549 /DNA_START=91 /DNA_END=258 /DNA_ORIENTATION=+
MTAKSANDTTTAMMEPMMDTGLSPLSSFLATLSAELFTSSAGSASVLAASPAACLP